MRDNCPKLSFMENFKPRIALRKRTDKVFFLYNVSSGQQTLLDDIQNFCQNGKIKSRNLTSKGWTTKQRMGIYQFFFRALLKFEILTHQKSGY